MNSRALLVLALLALLPVSAAAAGPPVPRGAEIQVSASGHSPSVAALQDGRFVVVWQGFDGTVRARFFDSQGRPAGRELVLKMGVIVHRVTQVAADRDGTFLVAWTGGTTLTSAYVRRFNPNGSPRGKLIRANAPSSRNRFHPSIAIGADGRFAVAWEAEIEPAAACTAMTSRSPWARTAASSPPS